MHQQSVKALYPSYVLRFVPLIVLYVIRVVIIVVIKLLNISIYIIFIEVDLVNNS